MIGATSLVCGGRYALDALFGDEEDAIGAQGIVYKASETSTGRLVAVKVFKHSAEEAKREYEMGIRCRHPNIIDFLEFDSDKKAIVMEAAICGCFFNTAIEELPMHPQRAVSFLEQLVAALRHMHEVCGVAHLDVKLENCLLTDHATLKLADFGFATEHTSPSPAQDRRGTPGYRSPEMYHHVHGTGPGFDAFAADAWAVGVCAHILLLGHPPFAENEQEGRILPALPAYRKLLQAQSWGVSSIRALCIHYGVPHKCDNLPPAFRAVLEGLLWAQPVEKRWSLKQLDAAFHAIQAQAAGRAAAPPQQLQEQELTPLASMSVSQDSAGVSSSAMRDASVNSVPSMAAPPSHSHGGLRAVSPNGGAFTMVDEASGRCDDDDEDDDAPPRWRCLGLQNTEQGDACDVEAPPALYRRWAELS